MQKTKEKTNRIKRLMLRFVGYGLILTSYTAKAQYRDSAFKQINAAGKHFELSMTYSLCSVGCAGFGSMLIGQGNKDAGVFFFAGSAACAVVSLIHQYKAAECLRFTGTGIIVKF